ncbi:hypothetical protein P152DRAFT_477569 [Eremomyces bilateralis CBS 781.70]|uniref:Uncharacterized protein n=1 Tax=Eremomyces bilateralis CBS 781.70 TaxID=1392243 RepID=A0A6G1FR62_9PEZI|nr:uncharacterized protein P152DRAFT_477569 [Eremomyces bilateralis CBS 781.70]KAF1808171.1 hypothetical protein P152DRAFT_477569 [Eremomyces bilateralis CBS 781.70]
MNRTQRPSASSSDRNESIPALTPADSSSSFGLVESIAPDSERLGSNNTAEEQQGESVHTYINRIQHLRCQFEDPLETISGTGETIQTGVLFAEISKHYLSIAKALEDNPSKFEILTARDYGWLLTSVRPGKRAIGSSAASRSESLSLKRASQTISRMPRQKRLKRPPIPETSSEGDSDFSMDSDHINWRPSGSGSESDLRGTNEGEEEWLMMKPDLSGHIIPRGTSSFVSPYNASGRSGAAQGSTESLRQSVASSLAVTDIPPNTILGHVGRLEMSTTLKRKQHNISQQRRPPPYVEIVKRVDRTKRAEPSSAPVGPGDRHSGTSECPRMGLAADVNRELMREIDEVFEAVELGGANF